MKNSNSWYNERTGEYEYSKYSNTGFSFGEIVIIAIIAIAIPSFLVWIKRVFGLGISEKNLLTTGLIISLAFLIFLAIYAFELKREGVALYMYEELEESATQFSANMGEFNELSGFAHGGERSMRQRRIMERQNEISQLKKSFTSEEQLKKLMP